MKHEFYEKWQGGDINVPHTEPSSGNGTGGNSGREKTSPSPLASPSLY